MVLPMYISQTRMVSCSIKTTRVVKELVFRNQLWTLLTMFVESMAPCRFSLTVLAVAGKPDPRRLAVQERSRREAAPEYPQVC